MAGITYPLVSLGQYSTDGANTDIVQSFAAVPGFRHSLAFISAHFVGGNALSTIIVNDDGTTIFKANIAYFLSDGKVDSRPYYITFPLAGLTGSNNKIMTITLSAGGIGVTGHLSTGHYVL